MMTARLSLNLSWFLLRPFDPTATAPICWGMTRLILAALGALTLGPVSLSLVASGAMAQQTAASDLQTSDAEAPVPLTTLERWMAEPGTLFEAHEIDIDAFLWRARILVVFADSPLNPNFQEQVDLLEDGIEDLIARDVLIVTDTDPGAPSDLRTRIRPRGFLLALVGKDGTVALRKPLPWDVRELSRSIDKMPLRQQEIEDRR